MMITKDSKEIKMAYKALKDIESVFKGSIVPYMEEYEKIRIQSFVRATLREFDNQEYLDLEPSELIQVLQLIFNVYNTTCILLPDYKHTKIQ